MAHRLVPDSILLITDLPRVQYAMKSKNIQHLGSAFFSLNVVESSLVSSDGCGRPPEAQL